MVKKLLLIIIVLFSLAVFWTVGVEATRYFIFDRQLASITDVPLYAGTQDLEYKTDVVVGPCSEVSYKVANSPQHVQTFYFETMVYNKNIIKRNWLGDGSYLPGYSPVRYYRKGGGGMQVLSVYTTPLDSQLTQVKIELCNKS